MRRRPTLSKLSCVLRSVSYGAAPSALDGGACRIASVERNRGAEAYGDSIASTVTARSVTTLTGPRQTEIRRLLDPAGTPRIEKDVPASPAASARDSERTPRLLSHTCPRADPRRAVWSRRGCDTVLSPPRDERPATNHPGAVKCLVETRTPPKMQHRRSQFHVNDRAGELFTHVRRA